MDTVAIIRKELIAYGVLVSRCITVNVQFIRSRAGIVSTSITFQFPELHERRKAELAVSKLG
jgi:hypothetical protein